MSNRTTSIPARGGILSFRECSMATAVVTSSFVTAEGMPVLEVFHEDDEEGGSLWQFHCGNGYCGMDRMQLVRLDTVLRMDPTLLEIGHLEVGFVARRAARGSPWTIERI